MITPEESCENQKSLYIKLIVGWGWALNRYSIN